MPSRRTRFSGYSSFAITQGNIVKRTDALLYGLAGLLVLASVPIYRAILRGSSGVDSHPDALPVPALSPLVVKFSSPPSDSSLQCTRGILYRHDAVRGAQAVVQGGQLVRCLEPVSTLRR